MGQIHPLRQTNVRTLEDGGQKLTFAPGQEIYAQDDASDVFFRLVSGVVRTTRLSCDGRRQVGDFHYAGDLFGLDAGARRFSAEALGPITVMAYRRSPNNDGVDRLLHDATTEALERTQEHLLLLGRRTARERVAAFLMGLAKRSGCADVELPMSRQDIADYLGLTIETVSRMVTDLQACHAFEFTDSRHYRVTGRAHRELAAA